MTKKLPNKSPSPDTLRLAYDVCRFLLTERDLTTLLQGVCDRMLNNQHHQWALIVLIDHASGGMVIAESGLQVQLSKITEYLKSGSLPWCGARALSTPGALSLRCRHPECELCNSMPGAEVPTLCVAIKCHETLSGFYIIQPAQRDESVYDTRLYEQIGEAIGNSLRRLFVEEASRQREADQQIMEERYALALSASQAGLWDWNIKTGEMYTSPNDKRYLDYRQGVGEAVSTSVVEQRAIHPDDREGVLTILNDHLAGRSEEYRIEYRVANDAGGWDWYLDRGRVVERDEKNMPVRMTGTHQNITLQKKQEQALASIQQELHDAVTSERTFLQTVIDSAGDPVIAIDLDYTVLLINQAAAALAKQPMPAVGLQEKKCYELLCGREYPCTSDDYPCPVRAMGDQNAQLKLIHPQYHGNGINNSFELDVSPLQDNQGKLYGMIEVARDVTDRLREEKRLRDSRTRLYQLAHHDTLTGLPNRLLFYDRLEQSMKKAARNTAKVAVLFLDLDRFKSINDTLGHDVGDELLVEVARRLQGLCRTSDTVARLGGDEFVFILDDVSTKDDAAVVANKIIDSMIKPFELNGHTLTISTSIGIGLYPDDSEDRDAVIKRADMALYEAKEAGRNRYCFYSKATCLQWIEQGRLAVEEFRRALQDDQLHLVFQPRYNLILERVTGFEASLQWHHPERGLIMPEEFVPLAANADSLPLLREYCLTKVAEVLTCWLQQSGLGQVTIGLIVAMEELFHSGFVDRIVEAVRHHPVLRAGLELGIFEHGLGDKDAPTMEELRQLAKAGVQLALEDFGMGEISLSRLQQLPLSCLKLHQDLVPAALSTSDSARLIEAITAMSHTLDLSVVALGVETEEQLLLIRQLGCDQAQGTCFSEPLGHKEALQLLLDQEKKK
ncbi:MAG: hypothetical protein CSA33_02260 [Desulfobulbus propionicus]|nr:MAG: hypothetical protein CSA33_02260 [Desulfobulbus propionicus]